MIGNSSAISSAKRLVANEPKCQSSTACWASGRRSEGAIRRPVNSTSLPTSETRGGGGDGGFVVVDVERSGGRRDAPTSHGSQETSVSEVVVSGGHCSRRSGRHLDAGIVNKEAQGWGQPYSLCLYWFVLCNDVSMSQSRGRLMV